MLPNRITKASRPLFDASLRQAIAVEDGPATARIYSTVSAEYYRTVRSTIQRSSKCPWAAAATNARLRDGLPSPSLETQLGWSRCDGNGVNLASSPSHWLGGGTCERLEPQRPRLGGRPLITLAVYQYFWRAVCARCAPQSPSSLPPHAVHDSLILILPLHFPLPCGLPVVQSAS